MAENWTKKEQNSVEDNTLISDIIFYGVLEPQKLSLKKIERESPRVGVLAHFRPQGRVQVQGENQQYEMWAYPDGIKIYDHNLTVINDHEPENSFGKDHILNLSSSEKKSQPSDYFYSFVHTDYSLNRTYFTAICWHEKRYIHLEEEAKEDQSFDIYSNSLPKCTLWQLQNDPHHMDGAKALIYLPQVMIVGSKIPVFKFHREMLKFYYRSAITQDFPRIVNAEVWEYFKDLVHVAGYQLAERELENIQIECKSRQFVKVEKKLDSFFLSCFFLPKIKGEGRIEVVDCQHSPIKIAPIQMPADQCFKRPNIEMLSVMGKVGATNLIALWKCVLLQKHILVFSMNNNEVVDLFESLLYLIEPIKWENIYIPFLPFHLVSNIDAIQSYLIGMSKIHMNYVIEHYEHQMKDIVLFDLDQNILIENTLTSVELPSEIKKILLERLGLLGFRKDTLFQSFFRDKTEKVVELDKIFRVKWVFFDALIYLLNNYRPFSKIREQNLLSFDREGYRRMFKEEQWEKFASQLIETMVFVRLCEYHLYEQKILKWNQSTFGGLFVYCQNIVMQKNKGSQFWKVPAYRRDSWRWEEVPYLQYLDYVLQKDSAKIKSHKTTYRIQNYLIKYIEWHELEEEYEVNLENKKRKQQREASLLSVLISFLLPWMRSSDCLQERLSKEKSWQEKVRNLRLVDLQHVFGSSSPQSDNKAEIYQDVRRRLKVYRQNKHKYLTIHRSKMEEEGVDRRVRKDRVSV